jgi:hypothetical protein
MRLKEAFRKLGYELRAPRSDWTATNNSGVCISLWGSETPFDKENNRRWIDTEIHANPDLKWQGKAGNKLRIKHLSEAIDKYKGRVHVVLIDGKPGPVGNRADIWDENSCGSFWQVTCLNPITGHFKAQTVSN